ncbi:MAG: DUF2877 domain-containing protein [Anaerolineales bacterium]|nr:DUF2877 domain-containing protein [Anaerolineales bacterium]
MQPINALSLAPNVKNWLANSHHPHILHVFDHACNLINEHREVLSVVRQQISNGPFNLVIKEDVCFSEHLSLESLISNYSNRLHLGNLTINTADAKLWMPRPDWEALHAKKDDILNPIANLEIASSPRSRYAPTNTRLLDQRLLAMTLSQLPITNYKFSNSLISSLANADLPSSLIATQKIAGLGIGLTPAGDDLIMGAILAAWIIHPHEVASVLAKEITDTAVPLTTSLSAAWLRSAGRGDAGILWHEFFDALISGDASGIQLQITKLLSVGETSGADALAGFFGVLSAFNERIIGECPF